MLRGPLVCQSEGSAQRVTCFLRGVSLSEDCHVIDVASGYSVGLPVTGFDKVCIVKEV